MLCVKKLIGLILLLSLAGVVSAQSCDEGLAPSQCPSKAALPHEIAKLIPHGFEVLDYLAGQLTDNGRIDYLVVIHHSDDSEQNPSPRPLLIYTARSDGTFQLSARNDAVVMRANDGGVSGDPYTDSGDGGLAIKNRYFTVQQGVAGGPNHWTDYVTFHYDTQRHTWLFHKEIFTNPRALKSRGQTRNTRSLLQTGDPITGARPMSIMKRTMLVGGIKGGVASTDCSGMHGGSSCEEVLVETSLLPSFRQRCFQIF